MLTLLANGLYLNERRLVFLIILIKLLAGHARGNIGYTAWQTEKRA